MLGKYKTAACGGLDSSFSYGGAAYDLLLCIDKLAGQGHVICEGVIAITSYGFGVTEVKILVFKGTLDNALRKVRAQREALK